MSPLTLTQFSPFSPRFSGASDSARSPQAQALENALSAEELSLVHILAELHSSSPDTFYCATTPGHTATSPAGPQALESQSSAIHTAHGPHPRLHPRPRPPHSYPSAPQSGVNPRRGEGPAARPGQAAAPHRLQVQHRPLKHSASRQAQVLPVWPHADEVISPNRQNPFHVVFQSRPSASPWVAGGPSAAHFQVPVMLLLSAPTLLPAATPENLPVQLAMAQALLNRPIQNPMLQPISHSYPHSVHHVIPHAIPHGVPRLVPAAPALPPNAPPAPSVPLLPLSIENLYQLYVDTLPRPASADRVWGVPARALQSLVRQIHQPDHQPAGPR